MPKSLPLQSEFEYYLSNQARLVEQYNGRVVVIKGHEVLGAYGSVWEAVTETEKQHPLGTFLVQKCTPGRDAYTMTFNSRLALA